MGVRIGGQALPPKAIPGLAAGRARAGNTLTSYGIGFGPVQPDIPASRVAGRAAAGDATPVSVTPGGTAIAQARFIATES